MHWISKTHSFATLYPLRNDLFISLLYPMATTILLSAFEFHYFRLITKVGTYSFDLSVSDVFHFSQCPLCSPGEEKGYKLQYSALENPMDCIVHGGRKESDTLYSSMLLQMSGFPSFVRLNNVYIYTYIITFLLFI